MMREKPLAMKLMPTSTPITHGASRGHSAQITNFVSWWLLHSLLLQSYRWGQLQACYVDRT